MEDKKALSTLKPETTHMVNLKNMTYKVTGEGCDTPVLKFKTKEQLCNALLDDDVNDGCARMERIEQFEEFCRNKELSWSHSESQRKSTLLGTEKAAVCVSSAKKAFADQADLEESFSFNWSEDKTQNFDINPGVEGLNLGFQLAKNTELNTSEAFIVAVSGDKSKYMLRARAGAKLKLTMLNSRTQQDLQVSCESHSRLASKVIQGEKIRCGILASTGDQVEEKTIVDLELKNSLSQTPMYKGKQGEMVSVRIKESDANKSAKLEILIARLDTIHSAKAESTVSEGIDLTFENPESGRGLKIICAPASK